MSHPVNDAYLEDKYERFMSSHNGFERCTILCELFENGFTSAADSLVEEWREERKQFFVEAVVNEDHLLDDEDDPDIQYWKEEHELGTPGDDYQIDTVRVEVPSYLNVDYWTDYKPYETKSRK